MFLRLAVRAAKYQLQLWILVMITLLSFLIGLGILLSTIIMFVINDWLPINTPVAVLVFLFCSAITSITLAKSWVTAISLMNKYGVRITYEETLVHICFDFALLGFLVGISP